jgi:hypothetical protein
MIQGLGSAMSIKWIHTGESYPGVYCTAQGIYIPRKYLYFLNSRLHNQVLCYNWARRPLLFLPWYVWNKFMIYKV